MIALFSPPPVTIADVQQAVASEFGVTRAELIGDRRHAAIIRPRWIAFLLARELTPQSLTAIGRRFGDRDHSTVLHGIRRLESMCDDRLRMAIGGARTRARRLAAERARALFEREPQQLGLSLPDAAEPELAL